MLVNAIFPLYFIISVLFSNVFAAALYKRSGDDSMTCPSGAGGAGAYAVPNSCKNYYFCTAGEHKATIQSCSGDTLFSAELRRCVVASRANCNK